MCRRMTPITLAEARAALASRAATGHARVPAPTPANAGDTGGYPGPASGANADRHAGPANAANSSENAMSANAAERFSPANAPGDNVDIPQGGQCECGRQEGSADAYPGAAVPVFVPDGRGGLTAVEMTWGFEMPVRQESEPSRECGAPETRRPAAPRPKLVFNTRIETALEQERTGEGMWARAIREGRCLVPVRAFFETHGSRTVTSAATGRPIKQQYRFTLGRHRAFLLAAVAQDGRFSIVTTAPNAAVAPVHDRMPLVLGPGESNVWLGPDFATLADRRGIALDAMPMP